MLVTGRRWGPAEARPVGEGERSSESESESAREKYPVGLLEPNEERGCEELSSVVLEGWRRELG